MIYGSVCSGIEAATVAWHKPGWKPAFFSEIERFPREVLTHHYPDVPLHGDFTTIQKGDYEPIELLVGGTPCQSFSVAGLRKGLDDPRGNLMLEFGALARRLGPRWLVWENVPGVLSSNGGKDFGSFLAMLAELGYGFAYRVLDAQYFGVAQRRRRVFVVGCFGDWRSAAAVLFERHSLQGNPAPSRKARQEVTEVAGTLTANCGGLTRPAGQGNELDFCVTTFDRQSSGEYGTQQVASTIAARDYKSPSDLVSYGIPGNWIGRKPENGGNAVEPMHDVAPCLTKTDQHGVAHAFKVRGGCEGGGKGYLGSDELAFTISTSQDQQIAHPIAYSFDSLASNSMKSNNPSSGCNQVDLSKTIDTSGLYPACNQGGNAVLQSMAVRRLTPTECERLQGFPDGYTKINEKTADGPRYKALGNSMAVPVMRWIGERIEMVDNI